jgi:hypothetical protein
LGGTTVLALSTSGVATRNRNNSICVVPPKVAKASTVLCCYRWHYHPYFANGNMAYFVCPLPKVTKLKLATGNGIFKMIFVVSFADVFYSFFNP